MPSSLHIASTISKESPRNCENSEGFLRPKEPLQYKDVDQSLFHNMILALNSCCFLYCDESKRPIYHPYFDYNESVFKNSCILPNEAGYEDILPDNPLNRMRIKLHEPFLLPRTIPLETVDLILQCAYKQKQSSSRTPCQLRNSLRDIAVLELLFATGVRVSELCFLRKDSINLSLGEMKIYGKGSKERLIQIGNKDVLSAVSSYYLASSADIENSGWFFVNRLGQRLTDQSVRNMINRYTNLAGIEQHITPHMFRHAFATLLLEEDVDIRYIQRLLGHRSISTTQIYTHVTSKKQRDILTAKHPRNKISI